MKDIPNKEDIWLEKINKGIYDTNFTEQDLEDYIREIYNQRAERATLLHFIEDEKGFSLGREMFHQLLKQEAEKYFQKALNEDET